MCDECLDIMSDGIRQGAEEERERIIALIEEAKRGLSFGPDIALVNNMIALVKGEDK